MDNAYVRSPRDVLSYFGTTEAHGLSDSQVEDLRAKHGRNGMLRRVGLGSRSFY
jgi:Ca2+ transporting ATPase